MGAKGKRQRLERPPASIPADDPLDDPRDRRQRRVGRVSKDAKIARFNPTQTLENGPLPPPENWFQTIEDLLTSPEGFDLTTATPLQRAICKIMQGLPFGMSEAKTKPILRALGGRRWRSKYNVEKAKEKFRTNTKRKKRVNQPRITNIIQDIVIVAAIRSAKSLLAAVLSIWASQTVRIAHLADGEIPRFLIFSLSLDNARAVIAHIAGALGKAKLKHLLITKKEIRSWEETNPWRLALEEATDDSVVGRFVLRHPSRRPMEIRVVAGKRAGASGLSRWLFGVCADEATRMYGATDAVVNYEHMRDAIQGRLLPGAQFLTIGSPWQSDGPVYEIFQADFGRNNPDRIVLVASGPDMNPYWWTPERCRALKRKNPQAYVTDVLGRFADAEMGLVPNTAIEACARRSPLIIDYEPGHDYRAAMDPAVRTNAWTLVIADCVRRALKGADGEVVYRKLKRVVFFHQWQGTSANPLSPKKVLAEAAELLKAYQLSWCYTDQFAAEHNVEIASDYGLDLVVDDWTAQNKQQLSLNIASQMLAGDVEIPNDLQFKRDIRLVKKKPIQKGVQILLPQTGDGRHCDYFPPFIKAINEWIREDIEPAPDSASEGYANYLDKLVEEEEADELERKSAKGASALFPYGDDDTTMEDWYEGHH